MTSLESIRRSGRAQRSASGVQLLVVLSGPSGVGKDAALAKMRAMNRPRHFVVTATTRPKRTNEQDGVNYIFLEPSQFEIMRKQGDLLEYAEVYGHWYGVPRQQVREAFQRGQDAILKVDVQGAATIKKLAPQGVFIFIAPPSMEGLERRLRVRATESGADIELRMKAAQREMESLSMFEYQVVSHYGRLDDVVACIDAIMIAEKCRIPTRKVEV